MYNPRRDISPVVCEGYLDLKKSLSEGIIPADLSSSAAGANGIEHTDEMLPPVDDHFDALRQGESIRGYKPDAPDGEGE